MLGLHVERLQRVGVGRVAGLGALGLRHVELVEEHHLQLLGRAEVDLLADHRERLVGGPPHLAREVAPRGREVLGVDGDAGALEVARAGRRAAAPPRRAAATPPCSSTAVSSAVGEVEHRAGVQHRGLAGAGVGPSRVSKLSWPGRVLLGRPCLQLALEVAQGQVGEVVGALVGPHEVRREGGVADQPGQRPAARRERQHRALRVVQHLGARSASPSQAATAASSSGVSSAASNQAAVPSCAASATDQTSPVPARQAPWTATPVRPGRVRRRRARPASRRPRRAPAACPASSKPESSIVLLGLQRLEEPVAQHPELQAVEERVHLVAVPRPAHQVVGRDRQRQVDDEAVELAVADHVAEVGAQALPRLALDLVGVGDDVVEAVVAG